jgi:geranyl-CoA carboxylase alpha subunit
MRKFNSVLIANRSEIACRIIRSARAGGYRTVAVYSDADAQSPHVQLADDAVNIGPGPVGESYLVIDKLLQAAAASGAEAIHPGYGFLSENAEFAQACEAQGLVFIGPDSQAIRLMGNKAEAKRRMLEAGVPCVPGYEGQAQDDETLLKEGADIGMPLMVKAAAGGGGRGMRLVEREADLANAITLARAEAQSAFGNGELILEKAILRPRHVEVQVFGDTHGNIIHLGERDCSVQRRHQKVVEEAPCPIMTPALRDAMGAAAVAAAKSINYRGAGTVEFLLDESGHFYFLEMNTRLQVEHPVTELVTGLDLVALQLAVAQGEPLGLEQSDVTLTGHAIEVRLYTEDPSQDFLPTSGPIELWAPAAGEGVRVDDGITTGQVISPFYDPMVAKIIAYADNREAARLRLIDALNNTVLFGPAHNGQFLVQCLDNETFADGGATTAFISEQFNEAALARQVPTFETSAIAATLEIRAARESLADSAVILSPELMGWGSAAALVSRKRYSHGEFTHDVSCEALSSTRCRVSDGQIAVETDILEYGPTAARVKVGDRKYRVHYRLARPGELYLSVDGHTYRFCDEILRDGEEAAGGGSGKVTAPMHGLLLDIRVAEGDQVESGAILAVLEAMKMHYEIVAEAGGKVTSVVGVAGQQVAADDLLFEITVDDAG